MKICGISMGSNNANFCAIETNGSDFKIIETGIQKLSLDDDSIQDNIKSFFKVFESFIHENNIELIGIKARQHKGKFAGGAISFKIESLIQLIDKEVQILSAQTIGSNAKKTTIPSELYKYQEEAFKTAYTIMIQND